MVHRVAIGRLRTPKLSTGVLANSAEGRAYPPGPPHLIDDLLPHKADYAAPYPSSPLALPPLPPAATAATGAGFGTAAVSGGVGCGAISTTAAEPLQ